MWLTRVRKYLKPANGSILHRMLSISSSLFFSPPNPFLFLPSRESQWWQPKLLAAYSAAAARVVAGAGAGATAEKLGVTERLLLHLVKARTNHHFLLANTLCCTNTSPPSKVLRC
jgi:hypothetical protein